MPLFLDALRVSNVPYKGFHLGTSRNLWVVLSEETTFVLEAFNEAESLQGFRVAA